MSLIVRGNHAISRDDYLIISERYKRITKTINSQYWGMDSEISHSIYVGSFGRGTAIESSDVDIMVVLPIEYYRKFNYRTGNGQSQLLQSVRTALLDTYSRSDISGDGQVVVIEFTDRKKFEILPAFYYNGYYIYPDSNKGGRWRSTNPRLIQSYMKEKNMKSNGLLFDICKHIRYVRDNYFIGYDLPGILIDTFVYDNIGNLCWNNDYNLRWIQGDDGNIINKLLFSYSFSISHCISTPGSNERITIMPYQWDILKAVLQEIGG